MSLLCDKEIIELCKTQEMIVPFHETNVRFADNGQKVISYGVSTIGYDVTLSAEKAVIFYPAIKQYIDKGHDLVELDPLAFDESVLQELTLKRCERTGHKYFLMPPHSFMLGYTNEYFKMPDDVGAVCFGKSTMARLGCIVNVTPIEPGFHGTVVLELSNTTPNPMRVYANQGVCQFVFHKTSQRPLVTYADKQGKYMKQTGMQLPIG